MLYRLFRAIKYILIQFNFYFLLDNPQKSFQKINISFIRYICRRHSIFGKFFRHLAGLEIESASKLDPKTSIKNNGLNMDGNISIIKPFINIALFLIKVFKKSKLTISSCSHQQVQHCSHLVRGRHCQMSVWL